MVTINIQKQHLFLILAVVVFLAGTVFVIATNPSSANIPNPGHSSTNVVVNIGGIDKTLQQAIDTGDFEKGLQYINSCTASKGAQCDCDSDEKYMFMTGNSAGGDGYCNVANQGTLNVYGTCDSVSTSGSVFACFK